MKNSLIILGMLMIIMIISISGCSQNQTGLKESQMIEDTLNSDTKSNIEPSEPDTSQKQVTTQELSKHNTESDCWVSFESKVYDVSDFMPKHKGGPERILKVCGTSDEFKKAFTDQHGFGKVEVLEKEGVFIGSLV